MTGDAGYPAPGPAGVDVRRGGCLCGAVRYRIELPPKWVAHCHCSMCRRAQGAGFVTWVGVLERAFALESGAGILSRYTSTPAAVRSFCPRCGTPLFFQSTRWPGEMHVTLATLDSADGLEPQAHSYWSAHVEWADWRGRELPKVEPGE